MKTEIVAKVKYNLEDPRKTDVVVRKVVRDDDGRIVGVYGLSDSGDWVEKPGGGAYLPECHLPVMVFDNFINDPAALERAGCEE